MEVVLFVLLIMVALTGVKTATPSAAPSQSPTPSPVTGAPTIATKQYARKMHYVSWIESFDEEESSEPDSDWYTNDGTTRSRNLYGAANADDLSERVDLTGTALNGRFPFLGRDK